MMELKIELRVDYTDAKKYDLIKEAAKVAAKHLYTSALLLQDVRQPTVALTSSDFFTSEEEILLADDLNSED